MQDAQRQRWYDEMIFKGHTPIVNKHDPAKLDIFVLENNSHNGPGCSTCGWSCCMHCLALESIPQCTGKKE